MKRDRLCQLISIIAGLVLIAGGIIIWYVVNNEIHKQVEEASVAIPENDDNPDINPWLRFITNIGDSGNQRTYTFNVFNLTNPVETMKGELPIYKEVGPYTFWSFYKMLDVELLDDEKKISFKDWSYYEPKAQLDPGTRNASADVIYHFNMGYWAMVNVAGSELKLSLAISAGVVSGFWAGTTTGSTFTTIQFAFNGVNAFKFMGINTMGILQNVAAGNLTSLCADYWLAGNNPLPIPGASLYYPDVNTRSKISIQSCQVLFNYSNPLPFTFFNTNTTLQLVFLKAISGLDPNAVAAVNGVWSQYGIDSTASTYLRAWLAGLINNGIPGNQAAFDYITNTTGYTPADAMYFQMATAGGYLGTTTMKLSDNPPFAAGPEFGYVTNVSLSIASMKYLMDAKNPFNFVTPTGCGAILQTLKAGGAATIMGAVGTNPTQTAALGQYINYLMVTFVKGSSSLIVKNTVYDFLFNYTDPLLKLARSAEGPYAWKANVVSMDLNETHAQQTLPTDLVWTGKGDVDKVLMPITYEGSTNYTYNATFQVNGNAPEQLGPYYLAETDNPQVVVFSNDLARTLHFQKVESGALSGLPYYRYRIKPEDWGVNPDLYMSIPYVMNMTQVFGKPVHITRPRMLGVNVAYLSKCGLQDFAYTTEDNDLYADYEPRTGKAIRGRYSLQANAYIPGKDRELSPMFGLFTNVSSDVFHPLFWGKKEVVALPNQIDAILYAYKMDGLRYGLTILLIAGGGFLVLGSIGLFLFERVKEKIL